MNTNLKTTYEAPRVESFFFSIERVIADSPLNTSGTPSFSGMNQQEQDW